MQAQKEALEIQLQNMSSNQVVIQLKEQLIAATDRCQALETELNEISKRAANSIAQLNIKEKESHDE